jgi:hypothetical protein
MYEYGAGRVKGKLSEGAYLQGFNRPVTSK